MPLVVDRYELGPIATNCYVVRTERGAREAAVIDPGEEAAAIRLELAQMGAACAGILVTHTHFDHIGAVADLAEGLDVDVYAPEGELDVLRRPDAYYSSLGIRVRPYEPEVLLAGGETVEVAGISFETLAVPGHSPAHLAFYADGCLFSGDVLFSGSVGRTDLTGASWETLLESIRMLIERYPAETAVYPGHGPPTTLGAELERNPFLTELRTNS